MDIKEKIVVSSTQLLLDFGIKGVTMDEVAASIGMSKRTLYEHFKDKKELIEACVENILQQQKHTENTIMDSSTTIFEELFMLFKHIDGEFNKRGKMAFEIKKYYPDIYDKTYTNHYNASYNRMREWLRKGVKQQLILPDIDIDLTVYVMTEIINNLALRPERITTTNLSFIDSFKYIIIYFFRGISTNKGVELINELINKEKKH